MVACRKPRRTLKCHSLRRPSSAVVGRRSRSIPLPMRPSRFSATRARSTPSTRISSPWTAAAWVRIILMTPMSMPSVTGPAPWSARLRPYSMSLWRSRCPIFSLPRSRFSVASVAALARAGWFPYGAHIGYMQINQVTESVQAGHGRSVGRQPLNDQGLGLARPFLGVVTA